MYMNRRLAALPSACLMCMKDSRQVHLLLTDLITLAAAAVQEASVGAMAQLEQLVQTPVHKMLGWLAGHRLPFATCTTNYIGHLPADKVSWLAGVIAEALPAPRHSIVHIRMHEITTACGLFFAPRTVVASSRGQHHVQASKGKVIREL